MNSYKAISEALGPLSTHEENKNLPRRGWPTKITPGAHQQLIQEAPEETRTSKALQASLPLLSISERILYQVHIPPLVPSPLPPCSLEPFDELISGSLLKNLLTAPLVTPSWTCCPDLST
ncbi:hypothetical protein ATANTOWER_001249 [Ataeniobius toweri]|uniref:Uncharacterized protein n=1 Tax=Ataeniobius toweri TaxID=208326 RepID=A0ABU7AUV4_9TELE|nr:hypothetical protein [Ataeniobius toweri]